MNVIKQMALKKIKNITSEELLIYSKQYNISITKKQATDITNYLKSTSLNPFEEDDRTRMFKKLAQITDIPTAQKAKKLFNELIKEYGLESWFY